jgi:hypothetical protein
MRAECTGISLVDDSGVRHSFSDGEQVTADSVSICCSPPPILDQNGRDLISLECAPFTQVRTSTWDLGSMPGSLRPPPSSFGALLSGQIPFDQVNPILGVIFQTNLFPEQHDSLVLVIERCTDPSKPPQFPPFLCGPSTPPTTFAFVPISSTTWSPGIPMYPPHGQMKRWEESRGKVSKATPCISFGGITSGRGVGIPDAILAMEK